jgi:hypothetical protein
MKKLQIGVCVDGLRLSTMEQADILKLVRKEYARLFGVDENSISLSYEIVDKEA